MEFCLHWVLHYPKIDCVQLLASLSSPGGPCCTHHSSFAQSLVNQETESQLPPYLPPDVLPAVWLPPKTPPILLEHGLQGHLQFRSITTSKLARSWPPSVSLNSLDYGLQLHDWVHCIWASEFIAKVAESYPTRAALTGHNLVLQVHCHIWLIMVSKEQFRLWEPSKGVTGYEWVPGHEEPH